MIEARNARAGPDRVYGLAYVVSHPIQYQAPLLRRIAAEPDINLKVFFLSNLSGGGYVDPGFGTWVEWDVPLLDGYDHVFLARGNRRAIGLRLREEFGGNRFDALWIHGYSHAGVLVAMSIARAMGIPVLLRGESHLRFPVGPVGKARRRLLLPRILSRAGALLAIGTLNAEFYRHYGVEEDRIHLMPYAVDNDLFTRLAEEAGRDREQLRDQLGLEPGRPVILFAGKLTPTKGPRDLLEAFLGLTSTDGVHPYLLFVGDGPEKPALEERCDAARAQAVKFLGFRNQSELPQYYDLCDVFVLPSHEEHWGLVLNEVMNAGRSVVVTSAVGAAPDLVKPGVNGHIVPVADISSLRHALHALLMDAPARRRMGEASRQIISGWDFDADIDGLRAALLATVRSRA